MLVATCGRYSETKLFFYYSLGGFLSLPLQCLHLKAFRSYEILLNLLSFNYGSTRASYR